MISKRFPRITKHLAKTVARSWSPLALLLLSTANGHAQGQLFPLLQRTYDGLEQASAPVSGITTAMNYWPVTDTGKQVSFNNIPQTLAKSYVSLSASTQNTSGLGNVVISAQHGGYVDHVDTVLVTWARASNWPALAAIDPTGYSHPVTAGIFRTIHATNGAVTFEFLGESTAWIHVPWRPEKLENGSPYPYNGYAFKATIPFFAGVEPPDEYAVLISYNTQTTGYAPTGVAGPYNDLNFGLYDAAATVGQDSDRDAVLWVKPDHWYYPSSNWALFGSPMTKVLLRDSAAPPGASTSAPVNAGSYHVIAQNGATVTATAFLTITPAQAQLSLANLAKTKDSNYSGPEINTVPPGLNTVVTYSGSAVVPNSVGTHAVQAVINDPNYLGTAADLLTVTGPLYQDWMKVKLPLYSQDEGEFAKDSDFDGDGLSNFIEYGLGTDPGTYTANPLAGLLSGASGSMTILRQKALPEAKVTLEHSSDLLDWQEVSGTVSDESGDMESVGFTPAEWLGGERDFLRIQVSPLSGP
jgi:hypothetical protein